MDAHVSLERERLTESLATDEARVGSESGMCHHVIVQVVRHQKLALAKAALEWSIAGVASQMPLEVVRLHNNKLD